METNTKINSSNSDLKDSKIQQGHINNFNFTKCISSNSDKNNLNTYNLNMRAKFYRDFSLDHSKHDQGHIKNTFRMSQTKEEEISKNYESPESNRIKYESSENEDKKENNIKFIKLDYYGTLKKKFIKEKIITSQNQNSMTVETNHDTLETNATNFKYFCKSQAGRTEEGKKKSNQDSFFAINNIFKLNFHIFAVLDGHGMHGHYISTHVKNFLTIFYTDVENYLFSDKLFARDETTGVFTMKKINENKSTQNVKPTKIFFKENFIIDKLRKNDYEFIKLSFYLAELDLKRTMHETNFSGTTCVLVLLVKDRIICANIGDSRAILFEESLLENGIISKSSFSKVTEMSIDHKPEIPEEKERIEKWGGVISKNEFNTGPFRVWVKNEKYPGIAMSRSIGDFVAGSIGVICKPDIFEFEISKSTKGIMLASDGVWEFLSSEDVNKLINVYLGTKDSENACKRVIRESTKCWKKEEIMRDDITVIVIFF